MHTTNFFSSVFTSRPAFSAQGYVPRILSQFFSYLLPARVSGHSSTQALFAAFIIFFSLVFLFLQPPAYAEGWKPQLSATEFSPSNFLAVDKSLQKAMLMEHKSPLKTIGEYQCTTGKIVGDKQKEGDQKTPEGIYFVKRHISSGLDWKLYGGIAYTLDYPNPIDKLRSKTGHGIWVHGRGHSIIPRETQGCVAINNEDLKEIGNSLHPGTPVVIAKKISTSSQISPEKKTTASLLQKKTREWINAWANRSETFFSFYNPQAYAKANGSFTRFTATKKRLFTRLDWIINWTPAISVIEGPGYWVTYFPQYYRAPNMTVQGLRRLYWQKNSKGEFLISGAAWSPRRMDLEKAYVKHIQPELDATIKDWLAAWRDANSSAYATYYMQKSRQGSRSGVDAIAQHKQDIWSNARPVSVELTNIRYTISKQGVVLTGVQKYADSNGYRDRGRKRIVLQPVDNTWRIVSEDWSRIR